MSCGKEIHSNRYSNHELADKLRDSSCWREARMIERGECLSYRQLREVEHELERHGIQSGWDYEERRCSCPTEEEDYHY